MKGKGNRRDGLYPPTYPTGHNERVAYDKERAKRKKCRGLPKTQESCEQCSFHEFTCPTEATEDFLNSEGSK